MCYEYQHKIKSDLKFLDESGTISNVYKLDEKQVELDEVYRKAEAFDAIDEIFDDRTTLRIAKYFRAVEVINKFYDDKEASQ